MNFSPKTVAMFILLGVMTVSLQTGCQPETVPDTVTETIDAGHHHGDADALHWPKENIKHNDFMISLGHHGNHWHGTENIEPAVAVSKAGEDIGDLKVSCKLMDGDKEVLPYTAMIFEPKTEEEPAHYAGATLTFPKEEKEYQVQFEIQFEGSDEAFTRTISVNCGH